MTYMCDVCKSERVAGKFCECDFAKIKAERDTALLQVEDHRKALVEMVNRHGCTEDQPAYKLMVQRPKAVAAPDLKAENAQLKFRMQEWSRAIRNVQRALERNENRELNMGEAWALIKEAVAFELTE